MHVSVRVQMYACECVCPYVGTLMSLHRGALWETAADWLETLWAAGTGETGAWPVMVTYRASSGVEGSRG